MLKAVVLLFLFVGVVGLPVWLVDHAGESWELLLGIGGYLVLFVGLLWTISSR